MSPGVARTAYRGHQLGEGTPLRAATQQRQQSTPTTPARDLVARSNNHVDRNTVNNSQKRTEHIVASPATPSSSSYRTPLQTPPSNKERLADRWQAPPPSIGSDTVKMVELSTEVRELGSQRDSLIEVWEH